MWLRQTFSEFFFTLTILRLYILPLLLLPLFSWFVVVSDALIVPKELPSILSVVYSNIPPIKKGTDSRLGFGFRLGEHADFQVVVELGPQIETRPIGNNDRGNTFSKRQIDPRDQIFNTQENTEASTMSTTMKTPIVNHKWLEKWRDGGKDDTGYANLPKRPYVPEEKRRQLQLLYKMATTTISPSSSTSLLSKATTTKASTTAITETNVINTIPQELQDRINILKVIFNNNGFEGLQENETTTSSTLKEEEKSG